MRHRLERIVLKRGRFTSAYARRFSSLRRLLLSILMPILTLLPLQGSAADGAKGLQLAVIGGLGFVNGFTSLTAGVAADLTLGSTLAFGLRFTSVGLGVPSGFLSGYSATSSTGALMAEGTYQFSQWITGTVVSARLGLVMNSSNLSGPLVTSSSSQTDLGFGAGAGYRFVLSSQFVLTPELDLILDPGASITILNLSSRLSFQF